jgi:1-deoxy-D-xylulose-5-phosphate reductoisomerase
MHPPVKLTILGATGSIGVNTLSVIAANPERFSIFALTAHKNAKLLFEQCLQFKPEHVVILDPTAAETFKNLLQQSHLQCHVHTTPDALREVATDSEVDYVMAAIVGAAGLPATLAAAKAGKRVLLANKEALVMSGELFIKAAKQSNATVLPVDSEHNAIYQCLPSEHQDKTLTELGINRLLLTASGGPFRKLPLADFIHITPEQACAHPNWRMGKKISVDSATMMNKGLEIIEARWLFNAKLTEILPIMHPQSIIHSMVEYRDGSVLAQLGQPDMRTPIAHVLGLPERIYSNVKPLNFFEMSALEFSPLDTERYPCLNLAYAALEMGGTACTILNAANEVAVQAFLDRQITFPQIYEIVAKTLEEVQGTSSESLESILQADRNARAAAARIAQIPASFT